MAGSTPASLSGDAAAGAARVAKPVTPANKPDERVTAPFIDVSAFAENAPSPNYNENVAAVYPTGIALGPDGESLYSANDLADSLGIIRDLRDTRNDTEHRLRVRSVAAFHARHVRQRDGNVMKRIDLVVLEIDAQR